MLHYIGCMKNLGKDIRRFFLVSAAACLMAVNINTLVHTAGLLPGGFSGITLLLQEVFKTYLNIEIPYSLVYWLMNSVPAAICFKYVGHKFTLLSLWMIILSGLLTDILPGLNVTNDILLCAIFGGIVNGMSICLCLFAGATSGGTDFISIIVSEKTGKSIWNYIFCSNVFVLLIFGLIFGWNRALYSIIFQYASTQILNLLYKRYRKSTLLIVSEKSDEIVPRIRELTHHDATVFTGEGGFTGASRKMIYTVVSSDEEGTVIHAAKEVDPKAFINILQTKVLKGNFFMKKND